MTKEEKLLYWVAQLAQQHSQDVHAPVAVHLVVDKLGVTEKSFWNMFNGLARANFLKKDDLGHVWLTSNGLVQVERLRG